MTESHTLTDGILAPFGRDKDGRPLQMKTERCDSCDVESIRLIDYTDDEIGAKWRLCTRCYQRCSYAGKPYMPSSGSEGMDFEAGLCDVCEAGRRYREACSSGRPWTGKDSAKRDCRILPMALGGTQPAEWVHDAEGIPTCTAFEPEREPGVYHREDPRQVGSPSYRRVLEKQGQRGLF